MPVTLHKILLRGPDLMRHFLSPIGQYSEEAAEARNKDLRNIRQFKARKISSFYVLGFSTQFIGKFWSIYWLLKAQRYINSTIDTIDLIILNNNNK